MHTTFLQGLWFLLIGVLWGGYFVLEGFDFGVAMLVRPLGRDEVEKRMIIHTIGPVWDGNEVWLLTAGGATFAAFPVWYATAFSGFYLALFLVLVALIIRGVSFEFWGKVDSPRWRSTWEWAMGIASGAAALLFGVAWANFIYGVPMGPAHIVHATLFDLLHPYALLGGLVTLTLFLTHGANFLALRTTEDVRDRARATARRVAPVAAVLMIAFLVWTLANQSFGIGVLIPAIVAGLLVAAVPIVQSRSDGEAFMIGAGAVLALMVVYCAALYPNALPSSTNHAFDLTLASASSSHYTLTVMTVVAIMFVPVVLGYTAWTYWVFRHRLGRSDFDGTPTPIAVFDQKFPRKNGTPAPELPRPPASTDAPVPS